MEHWRALAMQRLNNWRASGERIDFFEESDTLDAERWGYLFVLTRGPYAEEFEGIGRWDDIPAALGFHPMDWRSDFVIDGAIKARERHGACPTLSIYHSRNIYLYPHPLREDHWVAEVWGERYFIATTPTTAMAWALEWVDQERYRKDSAG